MLQTNYVIGIPLNHQDPFIQRHGSQLTANEPPPFRQPFTSRRGIRLAYSFPGPARGDIFYGNVKFAFQAFMWEEFMELVEDLGAEVNKYS